MHVRSPSTIPFALHHSVSSAYSLYLFICFPLSPGWLCACSSIRWPRVGLFLGYWRLPQCLFLLHSATTNGTTEGHAVHPFDTHARTQYRSYHMLKQFQNLTIRWCWGLWQSCWLKWRKRTWPAYPLVSHCILYCSRQTLWKGLTGVTAAVVVVAVVVATHWSTFSPGFLAVTCSSCREESMSLLPRTGTISTTPPRALLPRIFLLGKSKRSWIIEPRNIEACLEYQPHHLFLSLLHMPVIIGCRMGMRLRCLHRYSTILSCCVPHLISMSESSFDRLSFVQTNAVLHWWLLLRYQSVSRCCLSRRRKESWLWTMPARW